MTQLSRYFLNLLLLIATLISLSAHATPLEGSCVNYQFPGENSDAPHITTPIDTTIMLRTLREKVPVYKTKQGSTIVKYLDFDTDVQPINQTAKRIQIIEGYASDPLGWVDKPELLCQVISPLTVKGLPRKAFAKISTDTQSYDAPIYTTPDRNACTTPTCKPHSYISRFTTYFVFAIDNAQKRYLLSNSYVLMAGSRAPLVGWIDAERMIPWNTNLGLRPKNDSDNERESEKIGVFSGYRTLQDSQDQNAKSSVKLVEGNIWYTFPLHIPLIGIEQGHYHVAAPGIGMQGFKLSLPSIEALKRIDVFFILDGTASMEPYIAQTRAVVESIVYQLHKKADFKETTFRFGFLVYRDIFADQILDCNNGICETFPLPNTTCEAKPSLAEANEYAFQTAISTVQTTKNDKDDYPEQLFAAIRATIPAIASCENNTKLVFVIADHGDRQKRIAQQVIDQLKENFEKLAIYFIQPPAQAQKSAAYQAAYQQFKNQAFDFIKRFYTELAQHEYEKYFLSLKEHHLTEKVIKQFIKPYSSSGFINEIEQILANGESAKAAIQKYRNKGEHPILYLDWIETAVCEQTPERCKTKVDHQVSDFYIPIQEGQMQEEIVLIERHIDSWLKLIAPLKRFGHALTGTAQRQKFVAILQEEIQDILGDPPIQLDDPRTLMEMLEDSKNSLPLNKKSPLLQYTFQELQNLTDCELRRLIAWIRTAHALLTKVIANPTLKVSYTLEPYSTDDYCPNITAKGQNIKRMVFKQRQPLGKDESYRYGHALKNITLYWLPMDFLP